MRVEERGIIMTCQPMIHFMFNKCTHLKSFITDWHKYKRYFEVRGEGGGK